MPRSELPIIQQVYDFIKWYVPILNRLPKDHRFALGDRMVSGLYDLLERCLRARYANEKLTMLMQINDELDILRYQTRLLLDFGLIDARRYEYASRLLNTIGGAVGNWFIQQRQKT